ncbi:MAG: asparaginase [Myxococcota bacterium]|nr:asparaginase [Myxococcota bacterium]
MPSVVQLRGGHVDSVHPFTAVWVGPKGLRRWGEPFRTPFRSAAKPIQLRASLHALGDPELPLSWLALGTASHSAEPEHIRIVQEILAHFGLEDGDLLCGPHAPMHAPSHHALIQAGAPLQNLHNNCSGKHAFMAAACKAQGWDPEYRDAGHPLQRDIRERVAQCGTRPEHGVDGCGLPSWVLEVGEMATLWQLMVLDRDPVMGRIRAALREHPHLTSGTGRLDELVMAGADEAMLVKIGAQALFLMGFPRRRGALAVKVHSGVVDALGPAVQASLARMVPGAWTRPPGWNLEVFRNAVGRVVGNYEVQE